MKHSVVLLLLAALVAAGSEVNKAPLRLERSLDAMGSTFTAVLYGEDVGKMQSAVEQAFDEVRRLDHMLSNYIPSSELSEVNRRAAAQPVGVSTEFFNLLAACITYSRQSEGAFDISVGPLMKVWGFYKGSGRLPHRAEIRGAMASVGYSNILLDSKNHTVRFARTGVELDPGGIGKGYAVDRMAGILKESGVQSALINAAGSSIYAIGSPPNERGWRTKIRDPKDASKTAEEVYLKNQSMSTSGNYEKSFVAEGKIYSHIMDPRTGYPAKGMLSVSVIAPKTLDTEAWTKPYFIQGREWAAKHKQKGFRVFLCEDRSETACAWLQ